MTSVRHGAASIYRIVVALLAVAVVVEIFLAGLGIFRAMPAEGESVAHETIEGNFGTHAALGDVIGGAAVFLVILVLVALIQGVLGATGDGSPVAGAFHAINAFALLGLSSLLTWRASRWQLPTPAAELPVRASPQPPPA